MVESGRALYRKEPWDRLQKRRSVAANPFHGQRGPALEYRGLPTGVREGPPARQPSRCASISWPSTASSWPCRRMGWLLTAESAMDLRCQQRETGINSASAGLCRCGERAARVTRRTVQAARQGAAPSGFTSHTLVADLQSAHMVHWQTTCV